MTIDGEGSPPSPRRRFGWVRAASDRVPTRWFAAIGTGLFLLATAAFGGLATAATPPVTALEPGDEHGNDQLAITVDRAVILDEFPEAGVFVQDGERVLAVQVTVENRWTEAISASPTGSVAGSLQIAEVPDEPDSVARYDDATLAPWLQPGVPAQLVVAWAIAAEDFADGDLLHLTLQDFSLYTGSFVTSGQSWDDPVPAATLTLSIDDIGAGG